MKDTLTELVKNHLATDGKFICKLSTGIYVLITPRQNSLPAFDVMWDPELWRFGKKNPPRCFFRVEFKCLQSGDSEKDESLMEFLRNTMTPLREDLVLGSARYPNDIVTIGSVTAA